MKIISPTIVVVAAPLLIGAPQGFAADISCPLCEREPQHIEVQIATTTSTNAVVIATVAITVG